MSITLMRWFRRNQKFFLAAVVMVLMVAWGVTGSLRRLSGGDGGKVGNIRGETITRLDWDNAGRHLGALQAPIFLDQSQKPRGLIDGTGVLGEFVFQPKDLMAAVGPQPLTDEAVWRWLILVKEAETAGMQFTEDEAALPDNVDVWLRSAATDFIRVRKLLGYKFSSVDVSTSELWQDYLYQEEAVKLRIVAFRAEDFRPRAEFTEEEARELYEEYREAEPAPENGTPGYMAPERVRLEYAVAELLEFDEKVTVGDQEIEQYYAENREDYLIPEEEDDDSATEAGAGEEAGAELPAEDEEESGPEPSEGGDEQPERAPRYKPLEDVKEEIGKTLHARKVREAAEGAAKQALDFLDSVREQYPNEPLPLRLAAVRNGMTYERPALAGGVDLLSREELERTVPDGFLVAKAVFDEGAFENFVITVPGAAGGPMLVQVFEHREPEPRAYEEVRGRVREDLIIRKALEAAETVAAKLIVDAAQSSLGQAVAETNRRLDNLLGRAVRDQGSGARDESSEQPSPIAPDPLPLSPLLRVEETEFFSRGGITADVPRRAVKRAFELGPDELARIVEEGADPGCYVIQRIDARPADPAKFHEWLNASQFQFVGYRLAVISMHEKLRQEKARRVVRDWLAGLAEANPVPVEPEHNEANPVPVEPEQKK